MISLNETPVRTSKNFNINNIKIDNANIPNKVNEFYNVQIKGEISKIKSHIKLAYGLSNDLEEQVKNYANQTIRIEIVKEKNEDREIVYLFDKNNLTLVDNIQIEAKENSKATIIIKFESEENISAYHNGIINVIANENAKLDIIIVNLINSSSNNFMSIQNEIKDNAKIKYTIIDFGGENSITNYYSNLIGNNAENYINTIYLGKDNKTLDLNYIAELRGEKSNINIDVQGALKGEAKKHFKGTIDFKKGCKKSKGNENESCMLLSDKAKSLALPMLLCSEEDVEGNHSCSSGKVGDKELFYIMSRGFSQNEAMKLLVRAKFNKIIEQIKDEKLKEQISNEIDKRIE